MYKIASLFLFFFFFTGSSSLMAQFYYQDILTNRSNHDQFQLFRKARVTRMTGKSVEGSGEVTEGFIMEQSFNSSYSQVKTTTQVPGGSKTTLVNYYNGQGYLYRTVDSNDNSTTVYDYKYNEKGELAAIVNTGKSSADKVKSTESHNWYYNDRGVPEKMLRIREGTDTKEVRFVADDKGRVTEEQVFSRNMPGSKVYYYYDDAGRLTDIVRYQEKLGKLIPDYTFDYSDNGRLSEMMVVQQGGKDYLTWKYQYNEQGLKQKESCFTKQKRLAGSVEYSYEMKK
jgi:YD repeat-containing protein